jgi:acetoin utilization protein AcuB
MTEGPVWPEALPVQRWMRSPVVTIRATTRVIRAAQTMRDRKIRHLAVVDGAGRLIGMVSERDLRQAVFNAAVEQRLAPALVALRTVRVQDVMTWNLVTARPDTDLREAARLMHEHAIGALPVVADGALVGILTADDVLAALPGLLATHVTTIAPLAAPAHGGEWNYGFPDLTGAEERS